MPATVLEPACAHEELEAVHRAVQVLADGGLVVFPTETVYGVAANARDEAAVARLLEAKGRAPANPLTLAVREADEPADYCTRLSTVAGRLARRCWPGPLTLVVADLPAEGFSFKLPAGVRQVVSPTGTIGMRMPDHRYILSAMQSLDAPLVLSSANRSGQTDAICAEEVVEALSDHVELVLSDGRSKFAQPSTVVRVVDNEVEILRRGVLSEAAVRRSASLIVLLVCTGNTCRSPMGQVLFEKRIADKLGCSMDELEQYGVLVASAGVAAAAGGRASAEAVEAMSQRSLDLSDHQTQRVSDSLVRHADLILTMTSGHRQTVVAQWADAAGKTRLLCRDGGEIADPIGGAVGLYVHCADQMDAHLRDWMEDIDWASIPKFKDSSRD